MITLKKFLFEATPYKYEYGCVMAEFPAKASKAFVDFGKQVISDDMLYIDPNDTTYGRQKDMHVTIKFGLTEDYSQQQMQQFLAGTKPFYIMVKGMSLFENELFDVVKLDIEGEELRRLRAVFDKLPNEDAYKDVYHPHMTLAYVKPGLGKKLQKTTNAKNQISDQHDKILG
jgi:2'-5' RNA ligase